MRLFLNSRLAPAPLRSGAAFVCRQCLHTKGTTPTSFAQRIAAPYSKDSPFTIRRLPWPASPRIRRSSTGHQETHGGSRPPQRRIALTVAIILFAGAGAFAFTEKARHAYIATQRCGRVAITVALNIRDYLNILKNDEDWDNPEYQKKVSACHKRCAERALATMEINGSVFIKLGQHLSSLTYLLPDEWCNTFIPLQDKCPVSSPESVRQLFLDDLGKPIEEIFSDFDYKPIGAASLAQVHVATLRETGEKVAVKVQHPTLDEWASLDMWLTRTTFRLLKYYFPKYDLTWLSEEMDASLPQELDFRQEAANAKRTKAYFEKIPSEPLVVPSVIWADRRVIVMEYLSGRRLDDLEFLDSNGISRDAVSATLSRVFNEMIFGDDAPLHCDPHGGNLAVRPSTKRGGKYNFEVILYDHGLYRDIPLHMRRLYAHMWLAVLESDLPKMRHYAWEIARLTDDEFPIFASAITGRDFNVIAQAQVANSRNAAEKRSLTASLGNDLVEKLVRLLAKVPRIILLILKTNDLTRSLDENLQTSQGPARALLILAKYAARCVLYERLDELRDPTFQRSSDQAPPGSRFSAVYFSSPTKFFAWSRAIWDYYRVALQLTMFEYYLSTRRTWSYLRGAFIRTNDDVSTALS